MINILAALAAASIAAPHPLEPKSWIRGEDYPQDSLKKWERGYFIGNITVSETGAPLDCAPLERSTLARITCGQLMQRARFEPAHDEEGRPAIGLYTHFIHFRIPGTTQPDRPDRSVMHLTVDNLPEGVRDPSYVRIAFHVDSKGQVGKCTPSPSGSDEPQQATSLGQIACSQIGSGFTPPIARDAQGRKTASLQGAVIRFDKAKPSKK